MLQVFEIASELYVPQAHLANHRLGFHRNNQVQPITKGPRNRSRPMEPTYEKQWVPRKPHTSASVIRNLNLTISNQAAF